MIYTVLSCLGQVPKFFFVETTRLVVTPNQNIFNDSSRIVSFLCSWEGDKPFKTYYLKWFFNGRPINNTGTQNKSFLRYSGTTLYLTYPSADDVGTYECWALSSSDKVPLFKSNPAQLIENSEHCVTCKFNVIVGQLRIYVETATGTHDRNLIRGTTGQLRCPINNDGTIVAVFWFYYGQYIHNTSKHWHYNGLTLTIVNVDWADEGEYQCQVLTSSSNTVKKFFVNVLGKSYTVV